MRTDNRLFRILHVLLHMSRENRSYTSEEIGKMLRTNPALVRRTMGALRNEGYVTSEKGHGGGWQLACDLDTVTLLDIYKAVDKPTIFSIGASTQTECLVERVVNESVDGALNEAEALILKRFGEVRLSQLNAKIGLLTKPKGRHKH